MLCNIFTTFPSFSFTEVEREEVEEGVGWDCLTPFQPQFFLPEEKYVGTVYLITQSFSVPEHFTGTSLHTLLRHLKAAWLNAEEWSLRNGMGNHLESFTSR